MSNPTQQSVLNKTNKDKFLLVLNLPKIFREQSATDREISIDPLQISVFGTVVPTIQVPANEVRFAGQSLNVSSHTRPNYAPITVNFAVDNDFRNYWILWKWLDLLNSARGGLYQGTKSPSIEDPGILPIKDRLQNYGMFEYQTNFSIFALNEYNERTVEFNYYNAFLTSLGGIEYNYRDSDIINTTAEFQFGQFDIKLAKKEHI